MKFYSEALGQLFDTPEALEQAEADNMICSCEDCDDNVDTQQPIPETPTRKQLAAAVDDAETALAEAYAAYDIARNKAKDLSEQYLKECNAILQPAQDAIKQAESRRYQAIRDFNKQYGAYQVTYTGDKAAKQLLKAMQDMDKLWQWPWASFRF